MMAAEGLCWGPAVGCGPEPFMNGGQQKLGRSGSLNRANSAIDMRQLTRALADAREGTGQVRDALISASFRPPLPGLTKMVSKLSKEGCWRKALEVFEAVEDLGLHADTALTNSAISACDKGGRWQKALEIFDRMEALGLHRDAITYSATISALAKGKQWHAALQIFDHMQAHGVEADVVTCCSLINALERGGQWQLAEKLFLEMCTVQEEEEQLDALVRAAPSVPPGLGFDKPLTPRLSRSQTSPSSVLLAIKPGSILSGAGAPLHTLPTVNETGPVASDHGGMLNLNPSYSTQQNILDSLINESGVSGDAEKALSAGSPASGAAVETPVSTGSAFESFSSFQHVSTDSTDVLASAFAQATHISSPDASPAPSLDAGLDRAFSIPAGRSSAAATAANGGALSAFANAAGAVSRNSTPPLMHGNSLPSAFSDGKFPSGLESDLSQQQQQQQGLSAPASLSSAAAPFVSLAGPSRLQRGCLSRETSLGASAQSAAAAHLRRAISCFPDLDGHSADSMGGGTNNSVSSITGMFNFSHAARVAPNRVCCNALLAAYARAKPPQWQKALQLLDAMWSGGSTLSPDVVSYNTVLKACANSFQLSKGMEVYHEMRSNNIYPNATTYNCIIAAASDSNNAAVMQEIGEWLDSAPLEVKAACMNAYVSASVKVGRWEEALARFRHMTAPDSHIHPTAATFNTIMAGHMAAKDYPGVRLAFNGMRVAGISPNIVAYNTLLASLAAMGAWTDALDVLNAVLAASVEGVNANTATFNTVLSALVKAAGTAPCEQYPILASQAVQVYQQMQAVRGSAAPDSNTFNSLIAVLDSTGHAVQVLAVYNIMATEGLVPDAPTAKKVLAAALTSGQTAKAVQIAQTMMMHSIGIEPPQISALLGHCVKARAWDLALQLCASLQIGEGPAAAAVIYNFVLHAALNAGEFAISMQVLSRMQSAGLEVDSNVAEKIMGGTGNNHLPTTTSRQNSSSPANGSSFSQQQQRRPAAATVTFNPAPVHVHRTSSVGIPIGISTRHQPITPQISSSPGANISPGSPSVAPLDRQGLLGSSSGGSGEIPDGKVVQNGGSESAFESLETLQSLKGAGLSPDGALYRHVISMLVQAGDGVNAVRMCREAHDAGVLHCFAGIGKMRGSVEEPCVVDFRGCDTAVAAAVLVTWLYMVREQMEKSVENSIGVDNGLSNVKFVFGPNEEQDSAADGHAVRAEVAQMITTGRTSVSAFSNLIPVVVPSQAVSYGVEGPCAILELYSSVSHSNY